MSSAVASSTPGSVLVAVRRRGMAGNEDTDVIARVLRQVGTQLQRGHWEIAKAALLHGIQELEARRVKQTTNEQTPLASLKLPAKLVNALEENLNVIYVADLLRYTPEQVQQQPNIGDTMVRTLARAMAEISVSWGPRSLRSR